MIYQKRRLALASLLGFFAAPFALGVVAVADASPAPAPTPAPAPGAAPAAAATPPAPAASAASAGSLRAVIQGALAGAAAARGGSNVAAQLTELRTQLATATTERDQARADLATSQASLTSATTQVSAFCGLLGITAADLAGKDQAACATFLGARIKSAVGEEIAALGFPAAELPAASAAAGGGEELADIQSQMATTTDPVALGKLAAKANALRDKKPTAG